MQNTHTLKVFVNKESSDALLLEIKDAKGRVLQSENIGKNKHKMGLTINMSNLESGEYKLQLSDKTSTFTKDFRLEKEQKEELKIVI